jgi:NADPH2:quinone reductase
MNHAIRVHEHGGPEKLVWEEVPLPDPKPGEVLVRHKAVGLNYIDVYFRTGLYKAPSMPVTVGMEGAGIIEAMPAPSVPMPKPAAPLPTAW